MKQLETLQRRGDAQELTSKPLEGVTGYINAGGRGTRLNQLFSPDPKLGVAKALLEVGTPPLKLVDHHVSRLSRLALDHIVVGAGDQRSVVRHVEHAYGDVDEVATAETTDQFGTAGDLIQAIRTFPGRFSGQVLVGNVDTIIDLDERKFVEFHRASGAAMSIALTRNDGVPNQDAFHVDDHGVVVYCAEATHNTLSQDEAAQRTARTGSSKGALVIETEYLREADWEPSDGQLSLYRDVMGTALAKDRVAGYDNGHNFFIDVGTVQTWTQAEQSDVLQPYLMYS